VVLADCSDDAPQPIFHKVDLRDASAIDEVFAQYGDGGIWAVVHLAALKSVGESGEQPLAYYKVNVAGSLALLEVGPSADRADLRPWTNITAPTLSSLPRLLCTVHQRRSPSPNPPLCSQSRRTAGPRPWWR
jgi:hypothetical protein